MEELNIYIYNKNEDLTLFNGKVNNNIQVDVIFASFTKIEENVI